ncbi:MAG: hypothetical protein SFV23_04815 [Planctomycetaceae bacterium]|nr:hypothetical protein [Planctomycetaceae bacterium]
MRPGFRFGHDHSRQFWNLEFVRAKQILAASTHGQNLDAIVLNQKNQAIRVPATGSKHELAQVSTDVIRVCGGGALVGIAPQPLQRELKRIQPMDRTLW